MPGLGSKGGHPAAAPDCPLVLSCVGLWEGKGALCTRILGRGTAPCSGAAARKSIIFYCSLLLQSGWNIPPKEKLVILPSSVPAEFLASAAINTPVHENSEWAKLPGTAGSSIRPAHTPGSAFKQPGELSSRLGMLFPHSYLKKQSKRGKILLTSWPWVLTTGF